MLLFLFVQPVEKFAEAVDQVALGDHHEDRETQVERALDAIELLGDFSRLGLDLVGGVEDQAVGGNDQQQPVDRALRAVLREKAQEFGPFRAGAGLGLGEEVLAGGVENDRVIREPPVHVDRAAGALEIVLQARRKWNARVPNRFGLAGARILR